MIGTLAMIMLIGCGAPPQVEPAPEPAEEAAPAVDPRVEKAAAVANAIAGGTSPADAMAAQGLDDKSFNDLLYEIAADPELTKAYLEARR